jgi:hydrogenase assembly chaperone HypC/HupF
VCLGVLARVCAIDAGLIVVESEARTSRVSGLLLDGSPKVGDWVITHAGFALAVLTEGEADDVRSVRASAEQERA